MTSVQPGEYVQLSRKKSGLTKTIADLKRKTSKQEEKIKTVLKTLQELNNCWHEEYKIIEAALSDINSSQSSLKVVSEYKEDKIIFIKNMEESFRGLGIRKDVYRALADAYLDFGEMYKDIDSASEKARSKKDIFKNTFNKNLADLLCYQVPNRYTITYHDKELMSHSLGQRASAMMLFILSQKDCDLLMVDQPEDDLDGQSIYDDVIKLVRKIKSNQQFIFATHNANFPVLGDSEMIGSCVYSGGKIKVRQGSIDSKLSQGSIIDIMEGGIEAFERRKSIYQEWRGD